MDSRSTLGEESRDCFVASLLAMTTYAGIPAIANPSLPVILNEALHRPEPARFGAPHGVQGEAKNLRILLRVNSVKQSHVLLFYQELLRAFWRMR